MRVFLFLLMFFSVSCDRSANNNALKSTKQSDKEMKKVVVLLYGNPACGKLTIAKKITEKYKFHLMDNHYFNNIIFPYIELTTPNVLAVYPDINKIKKIWMDDVVKYGKKDGGFIFTDVLVDDKSVRENVKNMKEFAKKLGYRFLPIKLVCNVEDIKKRINTKDRGAKFKLTDFNVWKNYIHNTKFLDVENSLVINNSNIENTMSLIYSEIDK